MFAAVAVGVVACSTGENQVPSKFLTLRELDATSQPTSAALGILVSVAAAGGTAVQLKVSGGTIDDSKASVTCIGFHNDSLNVDVVAVHPTESEAIVAATLGNAGRPSVVDGAVLDAGASDGGQTDAGAMLLLDAGADGVDCPGDPTCSCVHFRALGVVSTIVVSLGRAPVASTNGSSDAASGPLSDGSTATEDAGDAGMDQ